VGIVRLEDLPADSLVAVDLPPGQAWRRVLGELVDRGRPFLPLDRQWTARERRRVLDLARPAAFVTPEGLVAAPDPAPIDPARAMAVVATSGTAGEPRLVELGPVSVTSAVELSFGTFDRLLGRGVVRPDDPWVCCLSPAHVAGLLVLMRSILGGAPVIVTAGFQPERLFEEAPPGAHVALVPTMLGRLVEAERDLAGLGVLLIGGDGLDDGLRAAAESLGGTVVSTYGLTESCGGVVYGGLPFERTRVRLGGAGEIELHGPTLMEGYRHDPAATAAAFTLDGWMRTGDLGSLDGEPPLLRVEGRAGDVIRTGAEKVWPHEVEVALADHPAVGDIAVAGRPDPEWGQRVVAFVVPHLVDAPPTLEALRAHAADRLARFKLPKELVLVPELPRTPSGKLRRSGLPPG
jgi:o-succinylbenzoate---CoA ligase